jgi:hypothetical protein
MCVVKLAMCDAIVTCGICCCAWLKCVAGKGCRIHRRCERREAERRLHHVWLLMPGWMVMLAEIKAALSAAFF